MRAGLNLFGRRASGWRGSVKKSIVVRGRVSGCRVYRACGIAATATSHVNLIPLCFWEMCIRDRRYVPHPTHSNVEQSLALVEKLKPKRAWFTHICHDLGHAEANARLPEHVRLAYDGLQFEVAI